MFQVVWIWNPLKWDLDFERFKYDDGDGRVYVGVTLFCFGPLRIGYHHYPPD